MGLGGNEKALGAGERRWTDAQRLPRVRAESRPASGGVWRGLSRSAHVAGLDIAAIGACRGPASSS